MKKWRCTVCGYIHEGEEPPEVCPVCGADKSKFVLVTEEAKPAAPAESPAPISTPTASGTSSGIYGFLIRQMVKNHAHPMSVHFPNGVLPAAVTFLVLAVGLDLANFLLPSAKALDQASLINLIFVVLVMPLVLFSGYVDWKERYQGVMTRVIGTKMICGLAVLLLGFALIVWRAAAGSALQMAPGLRWTFLLVHFLMLAFAAYAGYLGGRLVFKE